MNIFDMTCLSLHINAKRQKYRYFGEPKLTQCQNVWHNAKLRHRWAYPTKKIRTTMPIFQINGGSSEIGLFR